MPSRLPKPVRNRSLPVCLVLLALLSLVAACGGGDASREAGVAAGGFPLTVEHGLGRTEIPAKPVRVLAVGSGDVQIARALGLEIVGTTRNPASADGNWPGVTPPLPPQVMVANLTEPNLEQVAALAPDLILATQVQPAWNAAYPQLSQIAPTVPYLRKPLEDDPAELLSTIGRAAGVPERARQVAADSDARIERFRAAHPRLAGRTVAFGQYVAPSTYFVVSPQASSARLFARLGLRLPDSFAAAAAGPTQLGLAQFSGEGLGVLDGVDIGFVAADGPGVPEQFARQPVLAASRVEREGDLHRIPVDLAGAIVAPNPAVTGYILDALDPMVTASGY